MQALHLLASAGHKSPALIDIDYTVLVQLGIFLVLFFVLKPLVFAPFLALRKEREENIEGARERATAHDAEADEKLARYEQRLLEARKEAATGRAQKRAEGEAKTQELLADARVQAVERIEKARAKIATSVPAAELALRTKTDQLAKAIASRVLGRELS